MAPSGQTPLDTSLQEAQQSLLPPLRRNVDGKLLHGHGGITRKRVRGGMIHMMNQNPEAWDKVLERWFQDCLHPDPTVRAVARKSWVEFVDGKPSQNVEDETSKTTLQRPVINIIVKD